MYFSEDNTLEGTDLHKWITLCCEAADKIGRTISPAHGLVERVKNAGFVDVHHQTFKLPIGPWPKDQKLVRFENLVYIAFLPVFCVLIALAFTLPGSISFPRLHQLKEREQEEENMYLIATSL